MLLADKVIIITGVGPGLGREMAEIAAREGARVALAARSADFIASVATTIRDNGGEAIAVPTDVSDEAQCDALVRRTVDAFGRIDGLVNSALAYLPVGPLEGADLNQWLANIRVTCFGALRMARAVLPTMKAQRDGAIVNISSKATIQPTPGQAAYGVAKTALEGATRQLAAEFGRHNIRVNCARPGWMWGPAVENHLRVQAEQTGVSTETLIRGVVSSIPLGIIPPDEECAKAVLFLVSDYARVVTGVTLDVNGGEAMMP